MKIKVTYEKVFDSEEVFEKGYNATSEELKSIIEDQLYDYLDLSEDEWKFEKLEDDSK